MYRTFESAAKERELGLQVSEGRDCATTNPAAGKEA